MHLVPPADRPRARPTLVMDDEGTGRIWVEIALPPRTVHACMCDDRLLLQNVQLMAEDLRLAVFDFVRRTRATYFGG